MNSPESQKIIQTAIEKATFELRDFQQGLKTRIKYWFFGSLALFALLTVHYLWYSGSRYAFLILVMFFFAWLSLWQHFSRELFQPLGESLAAVEKTPITAENYANRGEVFAGWEHFDAAELDYRKSLELDPNDGSAKYRFAEMLHTLKRNDEALELIESVLGQENEIQAKIYALHGILVAKNDPERALKSLDEAIQLKPKEIEFYLARADFFLDRSEFDEAKRDLDKAEKLAKSQNHETSGISSRRGAWFLKQNEPKKALRELNQAIKSCSYEPELFERRAAIHDLLGNASQAENDRQKAEQLNIP